VKRDSPLSRGLAFRRYWTLIQNGHWDAAAAAFEQVLWIAPRELDPAGGDPFASDVPFFAPALAYARGIELLVPLAQHDAAGTVFAWAYALCREKIKRYPAAAMLEATLVPRAKFHQALARFYCADMVATLALLDEVTDAPSDLLPRIDELRRDARAALDRMQQPNGDLNSGENVCA
jgi:hypothetical protein